LWIEAEEVVTRFFNRQLAIHNRQCEPVPLPICDGVTFAMLRFTALSVLVLCSSACHRQAEPPKPYLAFVANEESNTVAAVDLADFHVVASIPVAAKPEQLAVRPHHRELWAVSGLGTISVIEFPALRVVQTLRIGNSARDLIFAANGDHTYVLDGDSGLIVFGDGRPGEVPRESGRVRLGGKLASLALAPDGKTLVVADAATSRLVFVSVEARRVLGSVEVGKGPGPIVILPDGTKAFVADTEEEKVSAADITSRQILSHIEISSKPTALKLKPDGGELFVLSAEGGIATIVDTFHDNVEQTFPTGRGTTAGVIRRDQSMLYLTNAGDGSVTCLDVENRVVLNSTHVGTEPRALALTPDERFLVVADRGASSLAVLRADPSARDSKGQLWMDPKRSLLITTVPVGAGPVDVVVPEWLR
jgi:YVTN family beta-propeller protein